MTEILPEFQSQLILSEVQIKNILMGSEALNFDNDVPPPINQIRLHALGWLKAMDISLNELSLLYYGLLEHSNDNSSKRLDLNTNAITQLRRSLIGKHTEQLEINPQELDQRSPFDRYACRFRTSESLPGLLLPLYDTNQFTHRELRRLNNPQQIFLDYVLSSYAPTDRMLSLAMNLDPQIIKSKRSELFMFFGVKTHQELMRHPEILRIRMEKLISTYQYYTDSQR
jgi:hypothetical protein